MRFRGYLELVSVNEVGSKPAVYSIGGFAAISADGRPYQFDWLESSSGAEITDGKLHMDSELRDFDEDYFNDSNSEVRLDEITPEFVTASTLTEVFYECYSDESEDDFIPLRISSFMVYTEDNEKGFSEEQLAAFNKNVWEEYLENMEKERIAASKGQAVR